MFLYSSTSRCQIKLPTEQICYETTVAQVISSNQNYSKVLARVSLPLNVETFDGDAFITRTTQSKAAIETVSFLQFP